MQTTLESIEIKIKNKLGNVGDIITSPAPWQVEWAMKNKKLFYFHYSEYKPIEYVRKVTEKTTTKKEQNEQ
jgi:hypothetical protein